ncbi:hypothetical protein ACGFYV_21330 [Streptomyces sp. NPDC048297]|uniref:hypothetical protein n=1 Tax=Streptomyces sp. NPDC048297 TaxID=3365531 RepID=UPI00371DA64A
MRIEFTWPRPGADDDRTLTLALPGIPVPRLAGGLLSPAALRRAIASAGPFVTAAAHAAGAGPTTRAALPYALRFACRALDGGRHPTVPGQKGPASPAAPSTAHRPPRAR